MALAVVPDALPDRQAIASAVNALLDISGLDQVDLASVLGLTQSTMNRRLNAKIDFKVPELIAIADHFKVPFPLLLTDGDTIRRRAWAGVLADYPSTPTGGPISVESGSPCTRSPLADVLPFRTLEVAA